MSIRIPPQADVDLRNSLTDVQSEIDMLTAELAKLRGETGPDVDTRKDIEALTAKVADARFEASRNNMYTRLTKSTDTTITTVTETSISFDTEVNDVGNFHDSGNPTRLTFPLSGFYLVTGFVYWTNDAAGALRAAYIRLNGSTHIAYDYRSPTASWQPTCLMSILRYFSAGDYVELRVYHDKGSDSTVLANTASPVLSAVLLNA